MLNVGQVVYDHTNERVLIFGGLEILKSQKTDKYTTTFAFILKDGTFILFEDGDGKEKFDYTNFIRDGKPYPGSFIDKCSLGGHYFGIIAKEKLEEENFQWAKEAIEEVENLIEVEELNVVERTHDGKSYAEYHIGEIKERKVKYSIDAPSAQPENEMLA